MKVKIVEGLKAKFPGVSNSIINRIAEKILETAKTEEEGEEAVEAMTFQQAIDANGDSRASEAANTALSKYEKKYALKDGKPISTGDDTQSDQVKEIDKEKEKTKTGNDDQQEPAWAKAQREKMEALEARLAAIDGDKIASTRKKQLVAAMGKAPEKLRARYEKDLARMNFNDDTEYSEWLEEVKTDMEAFVAEAAVKGVTFGRPPSAGGPKGEDKPSPEVAARIKLREAETAAPAILGLPTGK